MISLYIHRRYIWKNAWLDLRHRYSGTGIGVFWNFINPVLEILVYTAVFTYVLSASGRDGPYILYLSAGLLPWKAFADTILRGSNAFIEHSSHLKRMAVPPEIFVAKVTLSPTLILFIYLSILLPTNLLFGNVLGWQIALLPFLALLLQGFAFGIALVATHLRTFFLDLGEILPVVLYLWRWTMPIIYADAIIAENVQSWFHLNPPYVFIQTIRNIILEQQAPALSEWSLMVGWVLAFFLIGSLVHQKLQSEIREYI